MKNLVVILLSFCVYSSAHCYGQSSDFLEDSLRQIFSSDFGFVLVGAKPVAIDDSPNEYLTLHPEKRAEITAFLDGVFRDSKEFVYVPSDYCLGLLISRKALIRQVLKYPRLEEFVLNRFGSVKLFLHKIKASGKHLFDLLENDNVLISIVLGYGKTNGEFYLRYLKLANYLQKYPLVSVYPFQNFPSPGLIKGFSFFLCHLFKSISRPPLRSPWKSLEEEYQWMESVIMPSDKEAEPPFFITPPRYMARRCPESDEIRERYIKAKDALAKLFARGCPSEVIASAVFPKESRRATSDSPFREELLTSFLWLLEL